MNNIKETLFIGIFMVVLFTSCHTERMIVGSHTSEMEEDTAFSDSITRNWKLIWRDEFSENGRPDPAKWSLVGAGTPAWMCYCSKDPETVFVKDGKLNLVGKQTINMVDSVPYMTGCLETHRKFSFKYGKVEVRVKFPQKTGTWPAVWLMPEKSVYGNWPKSGEIDIMEHVSEETTIHQTIHSGHIELRGQKDNPPYHNDAQYHIEEFNVYGLEWYPDRLDFFVNGEKTFSYPKLKDGPSEQWPFDQPFYIIFDLAIGGCDWLEAPKDEALPATMEIDWVRVYQQK